MIIFETAIAMTAHVILKLTHNYTYVLYIYYIYTCTLFLCLSLSLILLLYTIYMHLDNNLIYNDLTDYCLV